MEQQASTFGAAIRITSPITLLVPAWRFSLKIVIPGLDPGISFQELSG
jgi:hypothetical protein